MKLGEVLDMFRNCSDEAPDELLIMYRTKVDVEPFSFDSPPRQIDVLAGYCKWIPGTNELIPLDGDNYSLDDEISTYEMMRDEKNDDYFLCVWY